MPPIGLPFGFLKSGSGVWWRESNPWLTLTSKWKWTFWRAVFRT